MREPSAKTLTSRLLASTALASALALTTPAVAGQVLPTGGSVASGSATIGTSGSAMTIQQTTPNAVINWNSFSVGAPNSVTFAQPNAGSATLNRVTGSTPSSIAGEINANGQVYLVNPNGIAITKSGTVNVGGGFVASTLGVSDTDFNNGKLKFTGSGASAAVSNDGTITTGPGGIVGLIGGSVSNSGTITAPLGRIALGSGEQATLDLTGDGFLQVALPTNATTADGKALVDVSGKVKAAGGQIAIKAATAANAVRNAINLSGIASARSARKVGGSIVLGGGDGGDVTVSGALDASGRKGGGSVGVTGHKVTLRNATLTARSAAGAGGAVAVSGTGAVKLVRARLDVSGATGGGTIAVGGSPRGLGPLVNAASTTVSASTLRADALTTGNGGAITVWSSGATSVAGALTARGGAVSGNGGSVETSGETAQVQGAHVDTTAAHGATGSWLIDPTDFTIAASGGDITGAALSGELATTSVTIHSTDNGHTGGEILVNDNVSWSSGSTLTLDAASNVVVGAAVTISGAGKLAVIVADTALGGTAGVGELQFALSDTASLGSVSFTNPALGPSLTINSATYTLVSTEAALAAITGGGNYALTTDIALTGAYTNSVIADFSGNLQGLGHTLQNLSISANGSGANVGLIGILDAAGSGTPFAPASGFGTVANLFLQNVSVSGVATSAAVGALVGVNYGRVSNSGSSGTVTGTGFRIGGLVGENIGLVENSQSSVVVNGSTTTGSGIGGLVGVNFGVINGSFASGAVTGDDSVGGLVGSSEGYVNGGSSGFVVGNSAVGGVVGQNIGSEGDAVFDGTDYGANGTVTGSYGYGGVFGTTTAGGVVGLNSGQVSYSFFNGPVSGDTSVGGVIGENDGSLSTSYAINAVSGTTNVGGLVGFNDGTIDSSFALGAVRGTTYVGGLVGLEGTGAPPTSVSNSYSTGAVSGTTGVGGLIGAVHGLDDSITNAYWDTLTSGQPTVSAGGVGYTTPELQGGVALPFSIGETPSNFSGGAAGGATGVYPYLTGLFPDGVHAISGVALTAAAAPLASGANGAVTVYGDFGIPGGGASIRNPGTTGANGYYYILSTPAALPAGANVVVYTSASTSTPSTGATNAATYVVATGANNQTGVDIFANTLTETTALPTYSALVAAVANATAGDTTAPGAIGGVANIIINGPAASATSFTIDQEINTAANLTINTNATFLAANITATGGIILNSLVAKLSETTPPVTLDSGSSTTTVSSTMTVFGALTFNSATIFNGIIDNENTAILTTKGATTFNASVYNYAGGTVNVNGPSVFSVGFGNNSGGTFNINGSTTLNVNTVYVNNYTNSGTLTFNGPVVINANVKLDSTGGTASFNSLIDSGTTTIPYPTCLSDCTVSAAYNFTATGGALAFAGAIGSQYPLGAVSITSPYSLALPAINAATIFAHSTGGNITLGGVLTASGDGTAVTLAADGAFVNDVGSGAIVLTGDPPNWLIYSNNPTADVFNGLNSDNHAIWSTTYPDSTAPTTGNYYIFAYEPTVTFTSVNDSKTYGTDATAKVATDYTVTGIDPGVVGAYLPDTPAIAYSGTPAVTSAGSPASATVAAGPYTIAVAPGSVTALNGYADDFVSSGKLTVNPEAITVTAAANTKIYDSTTSAAATPTVTTGTLYDDATLSETYASPNAGTGITLTPKIAFAVPTAAGNYAVTLAPAAVGTINPEPITVTATTNSKVYNTTTSAAATPTVTAGTLYDAATLSETYASPNAGTGITLNPAIAFASPAAAGNYAVTLTPAAVGTITPEPITVTAAANTKVYDSTISAAATPTVTAGTLYDAATLSETYATPNVGTGITITPKIAFASATAAGNYTVTLTPAAVGTITPEPITITAAANTKVYDTTTTAAATPTVTTGTLYDAATLSETYATPNAGTGITLTPKIAFASATAAGNYTVTLTPAAVGTITPEPITVTAAANTKVFDSTTSAAATPTVTSGTLYDSATLSETYSTPFVGTGLTLTPQIAFAAPAAASNYAVTLTAAPVGTITPEPITITAAANTKTYDGTTSAAAIPTVTTGVLYYPATLSETYASPNAGTGLTLIPYVGFSSRGLLGLGSNFVITLASTQTGTITPEPITVTATPNTKIFDGNTSAAALPVVTAGTLFDPATLSESYATPGPGDAINLIPAIAFNTPTTAGNYAVTLVPTGTTPPNTGAILPPGTTQINLSPSVFVNRNPLIGIPGGASTCGPDVQLPDPSSFADPVAAVQAISAATSQYVERCRDASQEDIANALERYADALQVIIEKLPPKLRAQLQHIPAMVRAAAVRARAAPTRAAAVRVLRQTVAMVHHEITLVRADDPDSARIRNAVSTGVSGVLNSAAVALARSEGI